MSQGETLNYRQAQKVVFRDLESELRDEDPSVIRAIEEMAVRKLDELFAERDRVRKGKIATIVPTTYAARIADVDVAHVTDEDCDFREMQKGGAKLYN